MDEARGRSEGGRLHWDVRIAFWIGRRLEARRGPRRTPSRRRIRRIVWGIWLTTCVMWLTTMIVIGGLPPKGPIDDVWQPSRANGIFWGVGGPVLWSVGLAVLMPSIMASFDDDQGDDDDPIEAAGDDVTSHQREER